MASSPLSTPRIAVLGAGIAGVTSAYKLMRRGFDVTVFDRQPLAGMETSFANGGQLSASNTEAWNSWPTILTGIRWIFRRDAPLLINPKPSWHKLSWFAEFIAAIPRYRENTIETARLALAARAHLHEMAAAEEVEFDRVDRGILHVCATPAELKTAETVTALLAEAGLEQRAVSAQEIGAIEPALVGDFCGGFFTPSDFTGDIHKYSVGLARACGRHGVTFRYDTVVEKLRHSSDAAIVAWRGPDGTEGTDRFDAVVIAAGVDSRRLAAMVGERVNVYPVKGYSITIDLEDEASREAAPWVSLLDGHARIVSSRLGDNRLRIAGTAEFCGENRDIRAERINPLIAWCRRHFPNVSVEHVTPWAGLRPMMPDMMPRVGATRHDRIFLNTGHGYLGWTLAAVTAELMAEAVERRFAGQLRPASRRAKAA